MSKEEKGVKKILIGVGWGRKGEENIDRGGVGDIFFNSSIVMDFLR